MNKFEIAHVSCEVEYRDEYDNLQSFRASSPTIDLTIEKLGRIERKLQALKKANNVQ
jgi:hypothetical protein